MSAVMPLSDDEINNLADNYPGMFKRRVPYTSEEIWAAIGKVAVVLFVLWLAVQWLTTAAH